MAAPTRVQDLEDHVIVLEATVLEVTIEIITEAGTTTMATVDNE